MWRRDAADSGGGSDADVLHAGDGFSDLTAGPLDPAVFGFTLAISVVATMMFGLLPAMRASNLDVASVLKDDGGGAAGTRRAWLRSSLVVAQVTLSMVLLVCAGLLLKSLANAAAADPGFDARNVLVAGVDLFPNGYDAARGKVALRGMIEKIATVPGVAAVSTVHRVPLGLGGSNSTLVDVDGYTPQKGEEMMVGTHVVGPDYFHTMNTPLLAGRGVFAGGWGRDAEGHRDQRGVRAAVLPEVRSDRAADRDLR